MVWGRFSSSSLSTSARSVRAQCGCVSRIRAKSSMLLMVVMFNPVNNHSTSRDHSTGCDNPSTNSRLGILDNSCGGIFSLAERLPAPTMM